jgi:hypothetical protein
VLLNRKGKLRIAKSKSTRLSCSEMARNLIGMNTNFIEVFDKEKWLKMLGFEHPSSKLSSVETPMRYSLKIKLVFYKYISIFTNIHI